MCRDDTTYRRQLRQVRRDLKDVPMFKDVLGMGTAAPAVLAAAALAPYAAAREAPSEATSPVAASTPARARGNSA
jgi:hypothetical protein